MGGVADFDIDLSSFPSVESKIKSLDLSEQDRIMLLKSIGSLVIMQTQRRFETQIDPDNKAWKNWSFKYKLTRHDGHSILNNTDHLINSFTSTVRGNEVEIKSIESYASTHQYGDKRSITRSTKKGRSKSYKRNIPQRKFLGINEEDKLEISNTIIKYINKKWQN